MRAYRRKKVWINPSFQTKYTLLIVMVALAILAVLGTLYIRTLHEQTRLMGVSGLAREETPADEEFDRDLREKVWQTHDFPRVTMLIGAAALLVLCLAYAGIRITFRAAGPVYAISRMLRALAMGQYNAVRPLRKGDEFRFLAEDIAALRESLCRDARADIALLERTIETLSSLPPPEGAAERAVVSELVEDLREAVRVKRERFGENF